MWRHRRPAAPQARARAGGAPGRPWRRRAARRAQRAARQGGGPARQSARTRGTRPPGRTRSLRPKGRTLCASRSTAFSPTARPTKTAPGRQRRAQGHVAWVETADATARSRQGTHRRGPRCRPSTRQATRCARAASRLPCAAPVSARRASARRQPRSTRGAKCWPRPRRAASRAPRDGGASRSAARTHRAGRGGRVTGWRQPRAVCPLALAVASSLKAPAPELYTPDPRCSSHSQLSCAELRNRRRGSQAASLVLYRQHTSRPPVPSRCTRALAQTEAPLVAPSPSVASPRASFAAPAAAPRWCVRASRRSAAAPRAARAALRRPRRAVGPVCAHHRECNRHGQHRAGPRRGAGVAAGHRE